MRNRVSMAASSVQSVPRPPDDTAWFMATGTVRVSGPDEQQGEQELVPGEDQAEHEGGGEAGDDLRQADLEEHPDSGRAVDAGRILDVGRQFVEEALHHPDGEGQIEGGVEHDDAEIGARQAHDAEHQDHRNDHHDRRQHARRQDDEEIGVVALQRIAREAEGGQRADDQRQQHRRPTR